MSVLVVVPTYNERDNLPILVHNYWDKKALLSALDGEEVGTLVSN